MSRKWGANRQLVTTLGGYRANFDAGRSDRGLRVSALPKSPPGAGTGAGG